MNKYIYALFVIAVLGFFYLKSVENNNISASSNNYNNDIYNFSINLLEGFTADEKYKYQANPQNIISGVKFTIPKVMRDGTNLSSDTYLSVESKMGAINSCSAEIFLDTPTSSGFVDEGGRRYSIAKMSGAGAGNRYDETVYATPVDGGCIAVRYFVHYSVFENYPEGTVTRFEEARLLSTFDSIRKTLTLK